MWLTELRRNKNFFSAAALLSHVRATVLERLKLLILHKKLVSDLCRGE